MKFEIGTLVRVTRDIDYSDDDDKMFIKAGSLGLVLDMDAYSQIIAGVFIESLPPKKLYISEIEVIDV